MTGTTDLQTLRVTREGAVAIVSIDNPPMNVINLTMGQELGRVAEELGSDDSVRAVIFRSATDGVFIAGADISMLGELDDDTIEQFKSVADVMDRIAHMPQPTIAELGGTTLGGGFELALACDFRFMATGFGEIGLPEVRLALLPGGGGTQRLPRLVGAGVATEMLLKGMRYNAEKALDLGIVHKVFAPDEIEAKTLAYAQGLAAQAPLALRAIKRLVRAAFETPGDTGLALEKELFLGLATSADAQEGIGAFFEGRKPAFTGS
jgi:enoyl-CoA hydratase